MVMQMKTPMTSSAQTRTWEHAVIWDSYRLSDNLSDSSSPVTSHDREVYEACCYDPSCHISILSGEKTKQEEFQQFFDWTHG